MAQVQAPSTADSLCFKLSRPRQSQLGLPLEVVHISNLESYQSVHNLLLVSQEQNYRFDALFSDSRQFDYFACAFLVLLLGRVKKFHHLVDPELQSQEQ